MAHPPPSVGVTARRIVRVPTRPIGARRADLTAGRPALASVGDIIFEVVAAAEVALAEGSDVPGTVRMRRGGSAANVCAAFARLGGRAVFIGTVGRDGAGRDVVESLRRGGVEVHVARVDAPTARLLALVTPDGERSFVTQRGAADQLRPGDLSPRWLGGVDALHVPGYSLYNEPLGAAALRAIELVRGRAGGALVSVDLSSTAPMLGFGRERARELIGHIRPDVLFANATEVAALFPRSRPSRLLELCEVAVVKQGSAGARLVWSAEDQPQQIEVAAAAIKATDTTGAGDAFAAGFLFSLLGASAGSGASAGRSGASAGSGPSAGRSGASAGSGPRTSAVLRRAALAGHRSAAALLRSPREEIGL